MVKKLVSIVTALSVIFALAPAVASAATLDPPKTTVSGIISNNGKPVRGARVTVVCNGRARTARTNKNGEYLVNFNKGQCPIGSKVTVVATYKGEGGVNSSTVTAGTVKMNVAIVNVALPELGLITGFGGLAVAGGAFFVVRRRQLEA